MSSFIKQAIQKTIVYSDIFNYPLTKDEIGRWLIGRRTKNLEFRIKNYKFIDEKDGFYFLKKRGVIVPLRKKREEYSRQKLKKVQRIAGLIKLIPTVKLVGVTGALAMDNAKKDDDIDLFIVTKKGLLWSTRLFVTILMEMTGKRRHPNEINVNNKICLNMFVDEDHLEIPHKEQDLFSAHEVLQMKLLWDRDNMYQKFVATNQWVEKYLPNAWKKVIKQIATKKLRDKNSFYHNIITQLLNYFEIFLKKFQLMYMRNRRTTEIISDGVIRFHPKDARKWVLKEYQEKLEALRLW